MSGLEDFTFFSELKYPETLFSGEYKAPSSGDQKVLGSIPLNSRIYGIKYSASGAVNTGEPYLKPNGDMRCFLAANEILKYKVYRGY